MENNMEKQLSKDQVRVILENAPKGTDQTKIVEELVNRGYTLEGLNDTNQNSTPQSESNATFGATGNEGLVGGTAKAIGNIPSSTYNLGKNVVDAVSHPVDTAMNIGGLVKGAGAKVAQLGVEAATSPDSAIHQRAVAGNADTQKFDALTSYFKDRYGSLDNLKKTAIEDPAGVAADISVLFTGGGSALTKVGELSKVAEISKAANTLTKIGQATEPTRVLSKASDIIKNSTAGKIASDVMPTSDKVIQGQVTKALELTQGDLATIQSKTGNDPARYIVDNNLLKRTPEETSLALEQTRAEAMKKVRAEVSNVKTTYTDATPEVINAKQGLKSVLADIKGISGLEGDVSAIESLINKKDFILSDMQTAKELLDQNSNIYSKNGDVKSATKARGLANIRDGVKTFIEDEVSKNTGGKVDIRGLNNDVQTTHALQDAIENRALRGQSRQYLTVFDGILGTGAYAAGGPLAAAGLVIAKKVAESPTFRLFVARSLSKVSPSTLTKMVKELEAGNLSPASQAKLRTIIENAKKNLPYVESGANALNQDQSKTE